MEKFSVAEKYKLELHWKQAIYERKGVCKLEKAYFSGPVLQIANKINDNDSINIDFYKQYVVLVKNIYVAKLSWGEVKYNRNGTVSLKDASLLHDTELNRVPKLKDNDFIIIDAKNHEEAIHHMHLVYDSYVVNRDGILYNF